MNWDVILFGFSQILYPSSDFFFFHEIYQNGEKQRFWGYSGFGKMSLNIWNQIKEIFLQGTMDSI